MRKGLKKRGVAAVLLMTILLSVFYDDELLSYAVKKEADEDIEYDDFYDDVIYDEDDLEDEDYDDEEEDDEDEIDSVDDTINLKMNVKEKGDHQYEAEVILTNLTDEALDNWVIDFEFGSESENEIQNLRKAELVAYNNGRYMIKNTDSNRDIPPRGSVSFEMTVSYKSEIGEPVYWCLNNELEILEGQILSLSYTTLQLIQLVTFLPEKNKDLIISCMLSGYMIAYDYL